MKTPIILKRILCIILVLALAVGNVLPANALHLHAWDDHQHVHSDSSTGTGSTSGSSVSFTPVDNSQVTAGLVPNGQTQTKEESSHADSDLVRVSIVLNKYSTIDAGYRVNDFSNRKAAIRYRETLKREQEKMVDTIENAIHANLDVVWNLTLAANIISANVRYGHIETIRNLPGVKSVQLESQYTPSKSESSPLKPLMATSGSQIGSAPVWAEGYTGAGMRIAVIDTGIDTDHQSMDPGAFAYALSQLAAQAGMTTDAYIESLDLLDAEEIATVVDNLNVTLDAAQAYVNGKIAFGYNYRDMDYDITHDHDEEGDHGSHVAGIATANSWLAGNDGYVKALETALMQGVAPDAQLLAMKVFGKNGSPYDSDFFAAIEDAIVLGADAINLSLGSVAPGRGHHSEAQFQEVMDNLTDAGVVVSISAGNAGSWVENAENGGYLYSTDVSMHTVSQPGGFTNSMCVASVENDGMVGYYFTVDGEIIVYIEERMNQMKSLTSLAGAQEYVFIDGIGDADDWAALADVLPGKVAICARGEINFTEKARLAAEAGAIAVMVYNNQSGIIYLDMTEFALETPVVSLTKLQGSIIREKSTPVYDRDGNLRYFTGTMNISNVLGKGEFGSDYYTMSDFSSWGVPGSLEMKPEITAPGGNIYSIDGMAASGDAYIIRSGTSMASPQVAGMSALLLQYIYENDLDTKTGMNPRHLAQSLLMSTARPILAGQDTYYPILQQGAGLANILDAIHADSYITMAAGSSAGARDGKVKVELFDDPEKNGAYSATFTLHNLENEATTIDLNADFFIQTPISDGEFMYIDTSTSLIGMDVVWYVNGNPILPASLEGMDFNGDGRVSASDGQLLLDYATGIAVTLNNKDKADVDQDGDIDSHDAYIFLWDLSGITATLPADGSAEITVDFRLPEALKQDLNSAYPNGTYIQGYLFAETDDTAHSIPVLGFFGNWTDPSMFDVGSWPTYDTGEDTRIPYAGILRGNEFHVRYANNPNYHYTLGGNPVITDEFYMPERNSINSGNAIHGVSFVPIRHADQSRVLVVNETTGKVILDQKTGSVNMAYYANEVYGWQNTNMVLETNMSLKGTSEGDLISMAFTLVPEYYIDRDGNVDWDALGEGASLTMDLVIDNTAPEIESIQFDPLNNTMTIVASDNEYIAAAGLYNKTGTRRLAATGAKVDIEKGETAEYTFSLDGINGKKFLVQVHDYAMNTATYLIEMQIGENAGVPDMMAFDLVARHWTTFTKDFAYDYKVGTPRLEYADHIYYAATIAEHYVFASTSRGELYVMPEDDLSDTTFVVDMGVILYDMAYNKADGNIYAVTENNNLVMIDKLSGELTRIGTLPKQTNTLACSPEGVFYFNELGTGKVYSFTLQTMNAPVLLMEDPFLTRKDPMYGDHNGTEGNMGMEYDPNKNIICWNSHIEVLFGSYITYAYYYEIDPATGEFTRYNDFWHEMSCLMIPDVSGRPDGWAKPTDKVTAVSLNKSDISVIKGTSASLVANVQPWTATNRNVTWTSADPSIATVDEYGVVTGIAPGTTTITAASQLDPTKTATCQVTVDLLEVTIHGTVADADGKDMFFSWNMATENTWKPGKALPVTVTSATWSPLSNAFYIMDTTDALRMHKVDAEGNLLASAGNENNIPLWDMAYSETFSTPGADKVTSIYYSYLLSAKDPLALDAVGFDLGSMCSYLVGITSLGSERVEDGDGVPHDTEHLVMLDNDGYIWHFWVYARDGGGFDALYSINRSDLNLEFLGYNNMDHMFCSLMADENGDLYLAAFTGETSEVYYLTYSEADEGYLAVKVADMGKDIWPATITSVTANSTSSTNAVHPAPTHTMSSVAISREELAAAEAKDPAIREQEIKINALKGETSVQEITPNQDNYYELGTAEDLLAFAALVNDGSNSINGKLTADIDMTGKDWTPIGTSAKNYTGIFDGQSHTVSNLTLTDNSSYMGLFGYVSGGTVKNVTVKDVNFSGYQYVGGIVGRLESGIVENCATTGTSTLYASCSSSTSGSYVGGVAGYINNATIQNCYNEGTVTGNGKYTGGVVGYINSGSTLTNCYNTGTVTGKSYTAGIAGRLPYSGATVTNCFNTGSITGETSNVGAVISGGSGTISNNYYLTGSAKIGETAMNGVGNYNANPKADTASATAGKDAAWFASAEAVTALNNGGSAWIAGTTHPVLAAFGTPGGTTPEPSCEHTNKGDWVTDDTNHWKVCADCGEQVDKAAHSYGDQWTNGKKSCECGKEISCLHENTGDWITTDETNHWKVCGTCGEKVSEAAHSYGDQWTNGKKSCECGKEISCLHENTGDWVTTDETNHWKVCGTCGMQVEKAPHIYQSGACECGKEQLCEHNNGENVWQYDDTHHWQICDNCTKEFNKNTHSFGQWVDGKKSCECGKEISCLHENTGDWITTDETNHWKVCADCGEKVGEAAHSYGDQWTEGKKSCECGKEISCLHENTGDWVTTDETNHWKVCGTCGEQVDKAAHNYQAGQCECGKEDPSFAPEPPENPLAAGENQLTSGKVYTYLATEDCTLDFEFSNLKGSDGSIFYDYEYKKALRLKIMVNGRHVASLYDNTKVSLNRGESATVELLPVNEETYSATLELTVLDPATKLVLGDNAISKNKDYVFTADRNGTLYTTIKELWCDGAYCSAASLGPSVMFRINGVAVTSFTNSYAVQAGDQITVLLGTQFLDASASAVLNLSYEGFYQHPAGSRGNPYILSYSQCPTNSVEIPAGTTVWYKLVGFPAGAYLTVEGANAYAIIGNSRVNAVNGKLTVPSASSLQIGNAGSSPATFRFSVTVEEGTEGNPKDLVVGNNNKVILDASESYFFDHVAKKPGTATITVSGENWRFWLSHLDTDGSVIIDAEDHRAARGDTATVSVEMTVGQSIVVKVGTMNSSWTAPGGEITVTFNFVPDGSVSDCEHTNTREATENEDPATCTEDGSYDTVVYCTDCGEELSRVTVPVSKNGHTPGTGATCTTAQVCTVCGAIVTPHLGHDFVDGVCDRCGALKADNDLVLGENQLTSGNVYSYTAAADGRLEFDFTVKDGSGTAVYQYAYGKGTRLKIMINNKYVPNLANTRVTVSEGQTITVELVSVDGGSYTAALTLTEAEPAVELILGDNEVVRGNDYSFITPQNGTLYTTIKELWYDGTYCTEASLTSTVVFKINGVAVSQFQNAYEVQAGDEITVSAGLSFGDESVRAVLHLSYDGFYQHPAGSRGNPYLLGYSQCPTDSALIPAGQAVWYRLSGFGSGYYLTVTGENAYVIIGNNRYNAVGGVITVPASTNLQIGNAGTTDATFRLSASITEGYPDNPKDLAEGDNTTNLPERGNYYYDFVAPGNGTATFTVSGSNWGYQYTVYDADGTVLSQSEMLYGYKGNPATVEQVLTSGQSIVIKLGTMDSSWSQPGGDVTVTFHFVGNGACSHKNLAGVWQKDDTHHWQICDFCGEEFNKAAHSYGADDKCVCGKNNPSVSCDHSYGDWVDGKKVCSKCGNTVICQHPGTTVKDQKDASCEEEGYTGDTYCTVCGTMTKKGTSVPATGHNYQDGFCTECGQKDPDYTPIIFKDILAEKDSTNGVLTITWDPEKMTLVGYDTLTDYSSVTGSENSLTLGYVALNGLTAGDAVAALYFAVADPADAEVTVTYKQLNNDMPGECTHVGLAGTPVTENKVGATCTEDGSYDTVIYCTACGGELSRKTTTVPATGHTEVTDPAKGATCTNSGLTEGKHCSVCGEVLVAQQIVPVTGHTYTSTVVKPSCTQRGYTVHACVCGLSYTDSFVDATGHSFTNYVSDKNATQEADGTKTASCDHRCGMTHTLPDEGSKLTSDAITSDIYDISDGFISGLTAGTTVKEMMTGINERQSIKVFRNGKEVSANAPLCTGMVIKLMDGNIAKASFTVVVSGDVSGDGKISITDLLAVRSHILNKDALAGAAKKAADTSKDGNVSITDFIQLKAHLLGKGTVVPN